MASDHNPEPDFENLKLVIRDDKETKDTRNGHEMDIREASAGSSKRGNVNSDEEAPNELSSSYSSNWRRDSTFTIDRLLLSNDGNEFNDAWNTNYREASIYLEEGYNNDKFDFHPRSRDALPAYLIVHNRYFYILDLLASLVLLLLAIVERPSVPGLEVGAGVHASLELIALSIVSIELCMKLRWMGLKPILFHTRTLIKMVTLVIMIIEALVVLIRLLPHFRVTRALRPVFLIDNYYCGGIRRVIRQILQSLPPIIDMLILLFFFMLIFSLFGFYLFSPNPNDFYFSSLERSFVSLFVLLTTANYPDVMMPSYFKSRWSALFFIAFLVIHLYFLMNLMLAVVYETFTRMDKKKFRKLLLHRRVACQFAFRLLVTRNAPKQISFKNFMGLMKHYKPRATKQDVYLMFKALDVNKSSSLTLDEFYGVYEIAELKWRQKQLNKFWFSGIGVSCAKKMFEAIRALVTNKWFENFVLSFIAMSVLWQIVIASIYPLSGVSQLERVETSRIIMIFVIFSAIEAILKLIGLGIYEYFTSLWNCFDFLITSMSILSYFVFFFGYPFTFVFVLRSFRLLKLFELKKRYRDIMGTFLFIMVKRFGSVAVVVLVVYYFFAIVGMEVFSEIDLKNCCKNTSAAQYFSTGSVNSTNGYYYLNNFGNIASSYVTLFELMVVNNWFILMDGYAYMTNEWSRLYFMIFYIITMVVITVVVAFVLDAFLFRIQYKRKMGDIEEDEMVIVDVSLTNAELQFCSVNSPDLSSLTNILRFGCELHNREENALFHGLRTRTRFAFNMKMYAEEVKQWMEEADAEEREKAISEQESIDSWRRSRRTISCSY